MLTLTGDADVSTDLTMEPGQHVLIGRDLGLAEPPSWGAGGFTVDAGATLQLDGVEISGQGLATKINIPSGPQINMPACVLVRVLLVHWHSYSYLC